MKDDEDSIGDAVELRGQSHIRGITRNILFLGATSLLTDVSSEMVFALLPFFMVDALGLQMAVVGIIEGAAESASSILKLVSGRLSDRFKRRKAFAVLGYSLSTVAKPFFAFSTTAGHIFAVRVLDRVGKGIRTSPRDALIADSISEEVRGKAYGFHRSADTVGAILGPLIAFLLFPAIWYRGVFLLSVIPGLLAVILLGAYVKEGEKRGRGERGLTPILRVEALSWTFKMYILVVATFTLSSFSYAFFLLRAEDVGVQVEYVPLLYLLFNIVYAASAFPVGSLADKVGKKPVLLTGYLMFGATCLGFALASSILHVLLLFAAYGMFFSISDTVQRAIIPDLVKPEMRGTAFGILHMTVGITAFPSSLLAGALWQSYGPGVPFTVGSFVALSAAILFSLGVKFGKHEG